MNEETLRRLPLEELLKELSRQILCVKSMTPVRDWRLVTGSPARWDSRRALLEFGDFVIFARFPEYPTMREQALAEKPSPPSLDTFPRSMIEMAHRAIEIERRYYELLYAVARAFPGESRHETALRYIRAAEANAGSGPDCEAGTAGQTLRDVFFKEALKELNVKERKP